MTQSLKISVERQNIPVATLTLNQPLIRIGRAADTDIVLHDPLVSNEHCILRYKDNAWILENTSRNGISLDNQDAVVDRVKITSPQTLRLGKIYQLKIDPLPSQTPRKERTILSSEQATHLLSVDQNRIVLGRAYLKGIDKAGEVVTKFIHDATFTIGTHPSNDFVCGSDKVSQFHARVDFDHCQFFLTDLSSTNGTFVDKVKIDRAVLKAPCTIRLGNYDLQFDFQREERPVEPKGQTNFMGMTSQNPEMQRLFSMVEVVAETQASVLIHGETGSGKELLARAIHNVSSKYQNPFIALNCAALPQELAESELFGHEKGSFTGATQQRIGAFEAAHTGTLFLDEIAELDLSLQSKLLRALESGEIRRVGSHSPIHVDVRVIAASHRKLADEVHKGRFREDLFFRLHVIPLSLPPLRERLEDLELLVPDLLQKLGLQLRLDADAYEGLRHYDFPGNIRELKNILQRAVVEYQLNLKARREAGVISLEHLRFLENLKALRIPKTKSEVEEREAMKVLLEKVGYNQSEAARQMGIAVSTFHDRLKRFGIEIPHSPRRQ